MTYSSEPRVSICDLMPGEAVDQDFLVRSAKLGEAKNGKPFVRYELGDRTGEAGAIQFDSSFVPKVGVYRIEGKTEEFNDSLQIKISSLSESDADPSDFVEASIFSADELSDRLNTIVGQIRGECGAVVRQIWKDEELREAFLSVPAARSNHHAYERGLAEHTLSMYLLADRVVDHYEAVFMVEFDRDLVRAGVILHDFCKARDFVREGVVWTTGVQARLVGHIAECTTLIHDACMACLVSEETRQRLLHVVLAHHGQLEWGSPVTPAIFEAQIVHLVDMMDSRFAMFRHAAQGLDDGELSEWVRPLGGRVMR